MKTPGLIIVRFMIEIRAQRGSARMSLHDDRRPARNAVAQRNAVIAVVDHVLHVRGMADVEKNLTVSVVGWSAEICLDDAERSFERQWLPIPPRACRRVESIAYADDRGHVGNLFGLQATRIAAVVWALMVRIDRVHDEVRKRMSGHLVLSDFRMRFDDRVFIVREFVLRRVASGIPALPKSWRKPPKGN